MAKSSSSDEWYDGIHIRRFRKVNILAQRPWYVTPGMVVAALEGEWADYDVVHAFHFVTFQALFGAFCASVNNSRSVITPSYHPWKGAYETLVARRVIRRADAVVAQCLQEREQLSAFVPISKIATIPCGVDENQFKRKNDYDLRSSLGLKPTDKVVLYVGDVGGHKAVSKLVSVMPLILRSVPDAKLLVVGGGSGHSELRALASSLGVEQAVRVTGQLGEEELMSAFWQSDAFALPSENESFGMVVLEAAVAGLPIVSTPVGVAPELVTAGTNGFLAESCDADFAEKLAAVLRDASFGENARRMAPALLSQYSWKTVATSLEALYARLLAESEGRSRRALVGAPPNRASASANVRPSTPASRQVSMTGDGDGIY